MKKTIQTLTASLALSITASALAQTQPAASTSAAPPPPPPPSSWDQFVKQAKNPAPWFNWGADVRLRNEYFNNALTLSDSAARHEQDYFRFRERLWMSVLPVTNLSVNARVAAEQREWMKPSYANQYGFRSGLEERYVILDNANVKWNYIGDSPVSAAVGRQDIMFGDPLNWWLVADGTPGDGSWTFFMDSVRLGYDAKEVKTKLDVVYIYQNALPDEWIPTIGRSSENRNPSALAPGPRPYYLTEQNEQGVILYASNKSLKDTQIDGYFIYKHDDRIPEIGNGDNADIYTFGGKVTGTPAKNWQYSVEAAYQFGRKEDTVSGVFDERDINACGANAKLTYLVKDKLNNQFSLVFEYLSGDDPDTAGKDEMFDVLWGRWPRTSELYIYSYVYETSGKIAQLNNLGRLGVSWSLNPMKGMTASATYNALMAPQEVPTRVIGPGAAAFSYDGKFRGHFMQAVLKHQFNKNVSAHLWGECVWEGNYYDQRDLMTFLRAEMMFTF